LGESWGRAAELGLVIGLSGDLGAGKTQFVKGLARGLGITARVVSPTFALIHVYEGGRLALFHLDLYRLDSPAQVAAAGLDEYLQPAGVAVIEWAERLCGLRPSSLRFDPPMRGEDKARNQGPRFPFRRVEFQIVSETERRIIYEDPGA